MSGRPTAAPGRGHLVLVHEKLAELGALVEDARAMPMSASCILNRGEVLALLDEIQQALPDDLARAERLLADRETVIDIGRQEAERLVEKGRQEQQRLVAATEVAKEADEEAERIIKAAQTDADAIRAEVDDYVDAKLANFEVVLNKTMQAVIRGRDRLRGERDTDGLGSELAE
jgi:cell division septum initiation protein DivIVA